MEQSPYCFICSIFSEMGTIIFPQLLSAPFVQGRVATALQQSLPFSTFNIETLKQQQQTAIKMVSCNFERILPCITLSLATLFFS